jgi:hypothetical protein
MRRLFGAGFIAVLLVVCLELMGCSEDRQTQPDLLARRKAIVEKKKRAAYRSKTQSNQGNQGYVLRRKKKKDDKVVGPVLSVRQRKQGLSPKQLGAIVRDAKPASETETPTENPKTAPK